MATSTTSVSSFSASPPFDGSIVTLCAPPFLSTPVTLLPSLKAMPCFSRMRCSCRATSPSVPGRMRSRYSTTVTCAPSRRHTEPSSSPMTPAPMTRSRFGTCGSDSAPVDDTTAFSSISMPGSLATSEPVAMTIALPSMTCFSPLMNVTSTTPGALMRPAPWKWSTLFLRIRKATPSVLPLTPSSLKASILRKVELRLHVDAHGAEVRAGVLVELGGMQQRLRGNAADVEAGAAERRALLDHRHLQPELAGANGAHIAAGACPDDDQIESGHGIVSVHIPRGSGAPNAHTYP